jgi:hypothetical protein
MPTIVAVGGAVLLSLSYFIPDNRKKLAKGVKHGSA